MREARGSLTQAQLAGILGYRQSDISDWEKGKRVPKTEYLSALAKATHYSMEWLLHGKLAPVTPIRDVRGRETQRAADEFSRGMEGKLPGTPRGAGGGPGQAAFHFAPQIEVLSIGRFKSRLRQQIAHGDFYAVPLLADPIKAGNPSAIEENDIEGLALIHRNWCGSPETTYALHVNGDSMDPTIPEGAIVTVDVSQKDAERLRGRVAAAEAWKAGQREIAAGALGELLGRE